MARKRNKYRVLDIDLRDLGVAFPTADDAAQHILVERPHTVAPFYVADETGDLLEVVLNGARWKGGA